MEKLKVLILIAIMFAACSAQSVNSPPRGQGQSPSLTQLLMYRHMFDMNMFPALYLSGHLGSNGMFAPTSLYPWMLFASK